MENIWGKYVYINLNKEKSAVEVVIDSCGQLPFFYYVFPNGNVLFSSTVELIFKVLSQKPEYNWNYLCSYIIYGNSGATDTPFKNVFELPPGCRIKITKNQIKTESFWDPLSSYSTSTFEKENVVDILQKSLKSWIAPYKNICISLSGGLDSSAIAYCLKDIKGAHQKLYALNFFHSTVKSSNERIYARKVCEELGIDLTEIDASNALSFDPSHRNPDFLPNKPFPGLVSLKWLELISKHLPAVESCIFLNGHGSDQIFMRPPSKKSLSDYILEKGLKGCQKHLKNITQFYRDPLYSIIKENIISLRSHLFSKRIEKRALQNAKDEIPIWLNPKTFQIEPSRFIHPIYENLPLKILPAKYEQIDALYDGIASIHMAMFQVNAPHYPFLDKPVVEYALSFPTYDLFEEGYDRYPLRKGISDRFKTETVWRRDKSQTTGLSQLGVKNNLENVLNICLEGQLTKNGYINKDELYKTIMLISNGDTKYLWHFMNVASCEIFFQLWEKNTK